MSEEEPDRQEDEENQEDFFGRIRRVIEKVPVWSLVIVEFLIAAGMFGYLAIRFPVDRPVHLEGSVDYVRVTADSLHSDTSNVPVFTENTIVKAAGGYKGAFVYDSMKVFPTGNYSIVEREGSKTIRDSLSDGSSDTVVFKSRKPGLSELMMSTDSVFAVEAVQHSIDTTDGRISSSPASSIPLYIRIRPGNLLELNFVRGKIESQRVALDLARFKSSADFRTGRYLPRFGPTDTVPSTLVGRIIGRAAVPDGQCPIQGDVTDYGLAASWSTASNGEDSVEDDHLLADVHNEVATPFCIWPANEQGQLYSFLLSESDSAEVREAFAVFGNSEVIFLRPRDGSLSVGGRRYELSGTSRWSMVGAFTFGLEHHPGRYPVMEIQGTANVLEHNETSVLPTQWELLGSEVRAAIVGGILTLIPSLVIGVKAVARIEQEAEEEEEGENEEKT